MPFVEYSPATHHKVAIKTCQYSHYPSADAASSRIINLQCKPHNALFYRQILDIVRRTKST
ncbi:hypothetical protein SAMN05192543_105444 [Paraburkholderia megapolitana]|uniref:Uncharacterized protein n=1 Tax=Paraburkholderia megapolitana TaxID=420953 RepID=A0A1I3NN16_9BURK|nr:hypothetical protein SAMN05192543_105444 [Paraburkholderia megapolitana]